MKSEMKPSGVPVFIFKGEKLIGYDDKTPNGIAYTFAELEDLKREYFEAGVEEGERRHFGSPMPGAISFNDYEKSKADAAFRARGRRYE